MKNYKFDVKKMTEEFNSLTDSMNKVIPFESIDTILTQEQMSEMIQRHAFKLGYDWLVGRSRDVKNAQFQYLSLNDDKSIKIDMPPAKHNSDDNQEIGLEFFNIKPVKMVTVEMPEDDYINLEHELAGNSTIDYDKWKLIK